MSEESPPPKQEIYWHHVPTVFTDGAIGSAWAVGTVRIVMGEVCFNIAEGATMPASRPVVNLVMNVPALRSFAEYINNLLENGGDATT